MPLQILNKYQLLLMAFKIKNGIMHHSVDVKYNNEIHQYPTRSREDFHVTRNGSQLGRSNFFHRGLIEFNNLKFCNKVIRSLSLFKSRIRKALIENYHDPQKELP